MKNITIICLLFTCIGLQSCKDNKKETVVAIETPTNVDCYKAIYEKDTLDMRINNLKDGKVTGSLQMVLAASPTKMGELAGAFRGDTLFVSYTFTDASNKDKTFKNPMAFLKKDNQLILGNGEIETTMGASYFVKDKLIDFDQVKYKFNTVDCVEK